MESILAKRSKYAAKRGVVDGVVEGHMELIGKPLAASWVVADLVTGTWMGLAEEDYADLLGMDDTEVMRDVVTACGLPTVEMPVTANPIASGAFGIVSMTACGRAVKRTNIDSAVIEMRALAAVRDSPHFVRCDGACFVSGDEYDIVMEYCSGGPLHEAVGDSARVRGWMHDLCKGLAWFHTLGWVHGDVKLQNILIRGDGSACLGDLGSAKDKHTLTATSYTEVYLDYETRLLRDEGKKVRVTAAGDVWALGVCWLFKEGISMTTKTEELPSAVANLNVEQPLRGMLALYAVDRLTAAQAVELF